MAPPPLSFGVTCAKGSCAAGDFFTIFGCFPCFFAVFVDAFGVFSRRMALGFVVQVKKSGVFEFFGKKNSFFLRVFEKLRRSRRGHVENGERARKNH